jgi:hypothetical protein
MPRLATTHVNSYTTHRLAQASLFTVAVVFLGLGAMCLFVPTVLRSIVEIEMPTRVAQMEIRGIYGGFFIGTGVFFLLFSLRERWHTAGLVAQASIFGGFVLGRSVGIAIGGAPNAFIASLFIGEILGLGIAIALLVASPAGPVR